MPAALSATRLLYGQPRPGSNNVAVLLQAAGGKMLGLYDGVLFVRINATDGTRITVMINCERELWRVARIEPRTG